MLAGVVSALLSSGCRDVSSPVAVDPGPGALAATAQATPTNDRPDELPLAALATAASSSAGMFFEEDGTLVVRVVDRADDRAALAHLARVMATTRDLVPGGGRRPVRVRVMPASYTFRQLAEWRDLAFEHALTRIRAVRTLDLDERANRVELGIEAADFASVSAKVAQQLLSLGVDPNALHFRKLEGSGPRFDMAPPNSLTGGTSDPIAAGIQIDFNSSGCSLGFVAQWNGVLGFVTASHCSGSIYSLDHAAYYVGGIYVGSESVDPSGYPCGVRTCRGSDANFTTAPSGASLAVGRIYRTVWVNSGSTNVDQSQPYFDIVESGSNLVQGQRVDKVGRTTGWTSGTVTSTCKDATPTWNTVTRCAYEANYMRGSGDSGGPVFVRLASGDSTEVTLIGVHSSESWEGQGLFSKLERIKSDLGNGTWNVIAHGPTPPSGPLSVSIAGPVDVNTLSSCTLRYWTDVSGGDGSYSYNWSTSGNIVETSYGTAWIKFPSATGHWVQVEVSDGTGVQVTAYMELVASSSGMECNN